MRISRNYVWLTLVFSVFLVSPSKAQSVLIHEVPTGVSELLQAISVVNPEVIWVSGHRGTYGKSLDGGETWQFGVVPGAERLEFRDVQAFSDEVALLMSAGKGEKSQLWRTNDGGETWARVFLMDHLEGFLDCMDFWDEYSGIVYGDSFNGETYLLQTRDGGNTWSRIQADKLPVPGEKEGSFAASGTCVCAYGDGNVMIGVSSDAAKVHLGAQYGEEWSTIESPMPFGEGKGIASVVKADAGFFVFGGDLGSRDDVQDAAYYYDQVDKNWLRLKSPDFKGAVYGAAVLGQSIIKVGPGGLAFSSDRNKAFHLIDQRTFWAVAFVSADLAVAVGPAGRLVMIEIQN